MDVWYPAAERNPAVKTGGTYIDVPFRGILHTTESSGFSPKSDSYGGWHNSYPHFTVVERSSGITMYQHIPIDVAARALRNAKGGVQTNRARAIQIEIVGKAAKSPAFSAEYLTVIGRWMRWVEEQTGIQRVGPKAFLGGEAHGENGAARMSNADWMSFNGWCGHQHVPENTHWDPGRIDIDRLLAIGGGDLPRPQPQPQPAPPPEPEATVEHVMHRVVGVDPGEALNVRAGPGVANDIVFQLPPAADGIMATGPASKVDGSLWYEIRLDAERKGWVHSNFLEPSTQAIDYRVRGLAAGDSLNVRSGAGTDQDVVGELKADDRGVLGTGEFARLGESLWAQIRAGDLNGWVNARYLAPLTTQQYDLSVGPEMDPMDHGNLELHEEEFEDS